MWYGGGMNNHYHIPSLRELYPWASEAELQEIGERLDRYVLLCIEIYEQIEQSPKKLRWIEKARRKRYKKHPEEYIQDQQMFEEARRQRQQKR
jgi:hypothetical protein